jgi:hypothetical protein
MEAKKLCDESVLMYLYMMVITLQHIQQHLASKGNSTRIPKSDRGNVLTLFPSDLLIATNNMLCNKLTFVEEKMPENSNVNKRLEGASRLLEQDQSDS